MKYIIFLSTFFLFGTAFGQDENLIRDAKAYSEAMIKGDFETMIQYTNDQQIQISGGPSYLVKDLEADFVARNNTLKPTDVNILVEGGQAVYLKQLQTIVTQELIVDFGGQSFKMYQFLFASSKDKGENWTFVDLSKHDENSFREFFPNFSKELAFPEAREAVLIEK